MFHRILAIGLITFIGPATGMLEAQSARGTPLTATPSLGFAAITRNGTVESGGMTALLEIDLYSAGLRWTGYAATHGIGVGCSDGCDLGGYSVGGAISYVRGPVGLGAGVGALRRLGTWHLQPHVQVSLVRGRARLQLRVEVPRVVNELSVPLLVGLPIPGR